LLVAVAVAPQEAQMVLGAVELADYAQGLFL
jgi:hypothetical protein